MISLQSGSLAAILHREGRAGAMDRREGSKERFLTSAGRPSAGAGGKKKSPCSVRNDGWCVWRGERPACRRAGFWGRAEEGRVVRRRRERGDPQGVARRV